MSDSNIPYEVPKPFNIILDKKNYIKQLDILINLFDKFLKNDDKINNELEEKLSLRIIFYMSQFYNQIIIQKMEVKPCFHAIMFKYVKQIKHKEKIIPLIIHKNIPDSQEIGQYLLELSMNKNDIHWKEFENLGFKILGKLKKHEILLDFLLKKGKFVRAINYMNEIFSNLTYQQIDNLFKNNKDIIEQNEDLLLNYLK